MEIRLLLDSFVDCKQESEDEGVLKETLRQPRDEKFIKELLITIAKEACLKD